MAKSFRITPARRGLIQIFSETKNPLSVSEIKSLLALKGININKTTVYRELSFLLQSNLIQEVYLDARKVFYESCSLGHHHHFVCKNCGELEDVFLGKELKDLEKKLEKEKGFKIKKHSLEFFGLCANCK